MKIITVIILLFVSHITFCQRPHLELGITAEFKDEFFSTPDFDSSSQYSEFHVYGLYPFVRVSKLNWGGEFGIGYEKGLNYFTRFDKYTTSSSSITIDRVFINVSPTYYIIKKPDKKWDVQIGIRNYFNLTSKIYVPQESRLDTWKMSARFSTNYTFKLIIFGVFYERDLKTDYTFKPSNTTFGCRFGLII